MIVGINVASCALGSVFVPRARVVLLLVSSGGTHKSAFMTGSSLSGISKVVRGRERLFAVTLDRL